MLLALDTATDATVVSLGPAGGPPVAGGVHRPAAGERPGHTGHLLVLAEAALAEAGASWGDVDSVAATCGPGGFTGMRVGLATAAGLAAAHQVTTRPVLSLDVLSRNVPAGAVLCAVDARRGELFVRRYRDGRPVSEPAVLALRELGNLDGVLVVGDGAQRHGGDLRAAGGSVPGPDDPRHRPDVAGLHAAASAAGPAPLSPVYLRAPDATPRRP